jgi:hypothetical protein
MSFEIVSSTIFYSDTVEFKNDICTICRQPINEDSIYAKEENKISEIVSSSICGHAFHKECLDPWLKLHNKCPICSNKFY